MTKDDSPKPIDIIVDQEKHELRIQWRDGGISGYPLDSLREACPCANCRGGHERMGPEFDPDFIELMPIQSYKVDGTSLVGRYALNIIWSDGHSSGIYTWDYLHRINPPIAAE